MADEIVLRVRFVVDLSMFAVRTTTDSTVAEFKLLVALQFDVPVDRQRLFHNNRELRNHRTIESYGLQDGNVVYLIRRSVQATASASTSVAAAATPLAGNGTPDISASSSSGLDGSSDGTVSGVLINVQYSGETRLAIRVRPESTVREFKDRISLLQNIPVNEQRLIYSGQFLQDEKTVGSYGVQEGHVIQLARRLVPATSCTSASVASPPPLGGNSTDVFLYGARFDQIQGFEGEASSLFGYGLPGFEQLQQNISGNPNTISEMMSNPSQILIDEPHIVRIIMMSNPGTLHPRREMVQNRITRNIESLPEGSSMLRQRYENVPEPLLNVPHNPWVTNAATRDFLMNNALRNRAAGAYVPGFAGLGIPGPSGFAGAYVPGFDGLGIPGPSGFAGAYVPGFAGLGIPGPSGFAGAHVPGCPGLRIPGAYVPGFAGLGIPGPSGFVGAHVPGCPGLRIPGPSGFAGSYIPGFAGLGIPGPSGFAGAHVPGCPGLRIPGPSGLDAQSSSFIDPATRIQALQHPAIFQIIDEVIHNDPQPSSLVDFNLQVQEALQNPEMSTSQLASSGMLQVIHNDPQSSSLVDFNPQVLEAVQNPEMSTSQLASRGRLQQSRASRAFPHIGISRGTGQTARGAAGMFDGQTAGRAVPVEESRINQQLSLLQEMGFTDNHSSLRALIATSGNIGAAVALLLQNLGM